MAMLTGPTVSVLQAPTHLCYALQSTKQLQPSVQKCPFLNAKIPAEHLQLVLMSNAIICLPPHFWFPLALERVMLIPNRKLQNCLLNRDPSQRTAKLPCRITVVGYCSYSLWGNTILKYQKGWKR